MNALIFESEEEARGLSYEEVRSELLSSVGKPSHPYREKEFWEMINRELARDQNCES